MSRYNEPIAANAVIGTNIFTDIGTSYVDFFGGGSTSYGKKMLEMYKRVTERSSNVHRQFVLILI
ncbi:hypothetical protein [Sphingobacterium sp.]|uniref:hypothetical protein n=1 Tax=Sphingobacterium sp. TaxID=341027 RepID=UPI003FA738BC